MADRMTLYPCRFAVPDAECPQTPTYQARECTSYAAWRGSEAMQRQWPKYWGNARDWPAAAHYAGFRVDSTPEVGCIMALGPNTNGAGPQGHVGWVVAVEPQAVVVQEYDFLVRFGYDERDFPIAGAQFIHLPRLVPDPIPSPPKEEIVLSCFVPGVGDWVLFENAGRYVHVTSKADVDALVSAGAKQITITPAQHAAFLAAFPNPGGVP